MDALSAFALASSVTQMVDFALKILSRSHELCQSVDGTLQCHKLLQAAACTLSELGSELSQNVRSGPSACSKADERLVGLGREAANVAKSLQAVLERNKVSGSNRRWQSMHQALRSVWSQKQISSLVDQLESIRKQVDTALLISLRERIDSIHAVESKVDPVGKSIVDRENSLNALLAMRRGLKPQHAETFNAVLDNDWLPSNNDHQASFISQWQSSTQADMEEHFHRMILARLYFSDLPDRLESIPDAHKKTFEWILADPKLQAEDSGSDSFTSWLCSTGPSNVYWITGKPGAGKSTLMKYLFNHEKIDVLLQSWHESKHLTKSGFFFWNSGTVMQMSRMGLLQSLLHQSLLQNTASIKQVFSKRWEQFTTFGGGREPFTWLELCRAFKSMISDRSKRFFFVIDGLDEFDGDHQELIDLILTTAKQSNVKVCTASRPWLTFEDAFHDRPSLILEHLTYNDIAQYVTTKFKENRHYRRVEKRNPEDAARLIHGVVDKASGVFFWVYLVVNSLLTGLSNSDLISDLQARVDALPSDLKDLFERLLEQLDPRYYEHACRLFRLVKGRQYPKAIDCAFADDPDTESGIRAAITSPSLSELEDIIEDFRRRLSSRCRGFLEMSAFWGYENPPFFGCRVRYMHRTAKDFLDSDRIWPKIVQATNGDSFDIDRFWANGFLRRLKIVRPDNWELLEKSMCACLEHAIRMERASGDVQVAYIDEICRTTSNHLPRSHPLNTNLAPGLDSYLKFGICFNLTNYVRLRIKDSGKEEVKLALASALTCSSLCYSSIFRATFLETDAIQENLDASRKPLQMLLRWYSTKSFFRLARR